MDGEYYAHLHMSVGNQKGEVFGGHLNRAIVSATCELVITVIDGRVDRVHDEETGLNIFKFNSINEQITKIAQNHPAIVKTSSSEAPCWISR